jgi:hypothetical protein
LYQGTTLVVPNREEIIWIFSAYGFRYREGYFDKTRNKNNCHPERVRTRVAGEDESKDPEDVTNLFVVVVLLHNGLDAVKLWQFWHLWQLWQSKIGQCCFDYKIDSRIRIDDASETNSGLDRGRFSVHAQGAARHHRR